jgi:NAD(P)H-flavin reductase/hemoglobin-like flavoprotein
LTDLAQNGLSAYQSGARLNHVAIALGGRFSESRPENPVPPDGSRRPGSWSAQVTATAAASVPAAVIDAPNPALAAGSAQSDGHGKTAERLPQVADLNWPVVKQTFARVTSDSASAMEYFYARLFTISPEVRALFPTSMMAQRERLFAALRRLVWTLDGESERADLLARLGRDHRRYGVLDKHYDAFCSAMRDTLECYLGEAWTPETSSAWLGALDQFAAGMKAGAAAVQDSPPWWIAEIVSHELRSPGVAVLRLRTEGPFPYQAGQYVPVQVSRWPRIWRPFSVASTPRQGGLLELHVRAVPGGLVSNTLVHHSSVGDSVLLGAAEGAMTLTSSDRDLLCLAGGTGLAPIKAIIEQVITTDNAALHQRKITLFFGARQHFDLYDLEDLQLLEAACPALHVIPVLSEQPSYAGLTGTLPDAVSARGPFENTDAYICGPPAMVRQTAAVLADSIPDGHIRHDPIP